METKNAVIEGVRLTIEDHGCLVAWVNLNYGGSGQGFGGYCLHNAGTRNGKAKGYAGHFITRCLEVAGVSEWSKLVGMTVRVKSEHQKVHAIGHILDDDWFNPTEDFEKFEKKETEDGQ